MDNAKTIGQLQNAAPLSDGDYLAVNQSEVFNPITGQPGDTRKVTVGELGEYVTGGTPKQDEITATGSENLLTAPETPGGQPGTMAISDFATAAQLAQKADKTTAVTTDTDQFISGQKIFDDNTLLADTPVGRFDVGVELSNLIDTHSTFLQIPRGTTYNINASTWNDFSVIDVIGDFDMLATGVFGYEGPFTVTDQIDNLKYLKILVDQTSEGAPVLYLLSGMRHLGNPAESGYSSGPMTQIRITAKSNSSWSTRPVLLTAHRGNLGSQSS